MPIILFKLPIILFIQVAIILNFNATVRPEQPLFLVYHNQVAIIKRTRSMVWKSIRNLDFEVTQFLKRVNATCTVWFVSFKVQRSL